MSVHVLSIRSIRLLSKLMASSAIVVVIFRSMAELRRSEGLWSEWGQRPTIHLGPHSSRMPSMHLAVVAGRCENITKMCTLDGYE